MHFLVDDEQYQVQDGEDNQLEEVSYINNQPQPPPGFAPQQNQGHAAPDADMK